VARCPHQSLGAPGHLPGCTPAESEQQDAHRIDALHDQVRDAMRERGRLAGAGARDDQQRPRNEAAVGVALAEAGRGALLGVQFVVQ